MKKLSHRVSSIHETLSNSNVHNFFNIQKGSEFFNYFRNVRKTLFELLRKLKKYILDFYLTSLIHREKF